MPDTPLTEAEVARYVAERCTEAMRLLVGRPELRTLGYLVDMARLEAVRIARGAPEREEDG